MQSYLQHFRGYYTIRITDHEGPFDIREVPIRFARVGQLREDADLAVEVLLADWPGVGDAEAWYRIDRIGTITALADLAEKHGCPPDVAAHAWLDQRGLVDADGSILEDVLLGPGRTSMAPVSLAAVMRALRVAGTILHE